MQTNIQFTLIFLILVYSNNIKNTVHCKIRFNPHKRYLSRYSSERREQLLANLRINSLEIFTFNRFQRIRWVAAMILPVKAVNQECSIFEKLRISKITIDLYSRNW